MRRYERHPSGEPEAGRQPARTGPRCLEEDQGRARRLSARVDEIPDQAAERRAEMAQAGIDEPVVHEPQAEPELEASWQPGDAQGYYEPQADQDAEPEMEIG